MKKRKSNASTVIKQAEMLFRTQGYGNTTMSEIGFKSNLLKGSVYHYFPSKEEIGIKVISEISDEFQKNILSFAYNEKKTRVERLNLIMSLTEKYFLDKKSCFMANLGLESASSDNRFLNLIKSFFELWTTAIAYVLEEKYGKEQANFLAKESIAKIEGAVIFLSICNDPYPLKKIIKDIKSLLNSD